ncbi:MAG: calcium-binding protein [Terrimicrobiaceae bacterium]
MKVLVTIPHFFDPSLKSGFGSTTSPAAERLASLSTCIQGLRETVGTRQASLLFMHAPVEGRGNGRLAKVNDFSPTMLDIAVCTTGTSHLIGEDFPPGKTFHHVQTGVKPMLLGFACHKVLQEMLGKYDYYCYMEDDLLLSDPLFFVKLKWFTETFGADALLQPHRFEASGDPSLDKLYIDGPVKKDFTAKWHDISPENKLVGNTLGRDFVFERPSNPHSGCFFLNATQMEIWAKAPHFLDGDTSFAGPLESAASLGIMKSFRIYKAAAKSAGFFELRHIANRYLGKRLRLK